MKGIFITGTDTGSGKTLIAGLLARYMIEKGYKVITQKWVQTGCADFKSTDIAMHLKIMARREEDIKDCLGHVMPYVFKTASSPHLASKIENKKIDPCKIIKSFKALARKFDFVIAEGSGGALAPLTEKNLMIDIAKKLDLPVLVVAQNKLGAINHTLLTVEALRKRDIKILGIVFNNLKGENEIVLKDNPRIIKALSGGNIFGILPWSKNIKSLKYEFAVMGEKICETITKINGLKKT